MPVSSSGSSWAIEIRRVNRGLLERRRNVLPTRAAHRDAFSNSRRVVAPRKVRWSRSTTTWEARVPMASQRACYRTGSVARSASPHGVTTTVSASGKKNSMRIGAGDDRSPDDEGWVDGHDIPAPMGSPEAMCRSCAPRPAVLVRRECRR